jgi:hypothetical protein
MRRTVAKLFIGMAITAIGMFGADSSLGTWKLNVAKSKSTSTNPYKSLTVVREATPDGGLKATRTGQMTDGTAVNAGFTCKYDGKECPATGGQYNTISIKRIDANTISHETRITGGKYHMTGHTVISADGKTMTQSTTGTDAAGKSVTSTLVFDKQ